MVTFSKPPGLDRLTVGSTPGLSGLSRCVSPLVRRCLQFAPPGSSVLLTSSKKQTAQQPGVQMGAALTNSTTGITRLPVRVVVSVRGWLRVLGVPVTEHSLRHGGLTEPRGNRLLFLSIWQQLRTRSEHQPILGAISFSSPPRLSVSSLARGQ